jgi:hypothetical protein
LVDNAGVPSDDGMTCIWIMEAQPLWKRRDPFHSIAASGECPLAPEADIPSMSAFDQQGTAARFMGWIPVGAISNFDRSAKGDSQ